jgi:hypothetical protein
MVVSSLIWCNDTPPDETGNRHRIAAFDVVGQASSAVRQPPGFFVMVIIQ